MRGITPFLWFDDQAAEAAEFYVSIFDDSRIISTSHFTDSGPQPAGTVLVVRFEINGQEFAALNGGPEFSFSPAISFAVACGTQGEIDRLWEALSENGKPGVCGWLEDRYGVSWQIVPAMLENWLAGDEAAADRVMGALLQMQKLDMEALKQAYEGER